MVSFGYHGIICPRARFLLRKQHGGWPPDRARQRVAPVTAPAPQIGIALGSHLGCGGGIPIQGTAATKAVSAGKRQMELLRFIAGFAEAHQGRMPTFPEMAAGIGVRSKSQIFRMLGHLEERGFIRRKRWHVRAIELLRLPAIPHAPDGAPLHFIPVARLAAAPAFHEDNHA